MSGLMLEGDDPRPGRPTTSTNDDYVGRVCAVIRGNRHLTVQEASIGSCHQIFTEKLDASHQCKIHAAFVD